MTSTNHKRKSRFSELKKTAQGMQDALQAICDAFGHQDSILIDQCKAALAKAKGAA
jgi:hypothetical protein